MIDKDFILAGKAVFTVVCGENTLVDCKPHYTFRVRHKPADMFNREVYFVACMTGSDNERSYSYMGILDPLTGHVDLRGKTKFTDQSTQVRILSRVLACLWAGQGNKIVAAGWDVKHAGKCCKCGRTLTHPESLETGWGPECSGKGYSKKTKKPKLEGVK